MRIYFMFSRRQNFDVKPYNKVYYGEVNTDFALIDKILNLLPPNLFTNPDIKWLDPCCGCGYFSIALYQRLFKSLQSIIPNGEERRRHIVTRMLYMIELNPEHFSRIISVFGEKANILIGDFLDMSNMQFDVIVGNPPFTSGGVIKTPTNTADCKRRDGKAIWMQFVVSALHNLVPGGYLAMITPSIWMKCDHSLHSFIRQWDVLKLNTRTSTETNRLFHGHAQTPTCFFSLRKTTSGVPILLYDQIIGGYLPYQLPKSIPLSAVSIIHKLHKYVITHGPIPVIKTNMRPGYKGLHLVPIPDKLHRFPNISTCRLNGQQAVLKINYSNIRCSYAGQPKLVLAHKMYGFPYHDISGCYGISNRDNYVITGLPYRDLHQIQQFLSTKLAILIFNTTRYRMQYLERYAFSFLPNIAQMLPHPLPINDSILADYFQFDIHERQAIRAVTNKNYLLP